MASILYEGPEFKIKNQHMIKAIWNNVEQRPGHFDEELVIPIIDNAREDWMLVDDLRACMKKVHSFKNKIKREKPQEKGELEGDNKGRIVEYMEI